MATKTKAAVQFTVYSTSKGWKTLPWVNEHLLNRHGIVTPRLTATTKAECRDLARVDGFVFLKAECRETPEGFQIWDVICFDTPADRKEHFARFAR